MLWMILCLTVQVNNPLILGNPSNAERNENNYLITRPQYVLSYNRSLGRANWVAWHLNKDNLGKVERTDNFVADSLLPKGWYLVNDKSYHDSGFDQGHLCPAADRTTSKEDNAATFTYSNAVPQNPQHNRGIWKNFENYCRQLAETGNELYIFTGPLGTGGESNNGFHLTIDNNRIHVPSSLWKVIIVLPDGENDLNRIDSKTFTLAVIIPNYDVKGTWNDYVCSIDMVEQLTNCNFLSNLPQTIQDSLED